MSKNHQEQILEITKSQPEAPKEKAVQKRNILKMIQEVQ